MQCYPEYKESRIDSIGKIPEHWVSSKLGYVSTIFKGGTPKRNVDRYFQGDLPWARPVDITGLKEALYINDTKIHISEEALGNSGARRLPVGTVLLTSRATIGETAITTVPMATNQGFANFYCNPELFNVFLVYYLQAIKDLLISLGSGSTFLEVTKRTLLGVGIPVPPLPEQTQIANFLDRKTQQIDKLIRVKERKIELLQEYRASLINQAVTKGLDPNVEMKPSGIGWMGAIPRHWTTKRLKYLGKSIIGLSYKPDNLTDDKQGTLVLRASNIQDGKPSFVDNVYVNVKVDEKIVVKEGDILICSRSGSRNLIGKNMTITKELEGVTFGVFMTVFRTRFFRFISHFLSSQVFKSYSGLFHTSTINQLTINTLNNFKICLPPYDEQAKIADLLDGKTKQLDELRSNEEQTIKLLKEYRQSLISAVVTGKMDVRDEV